MKVGSLSSAANNALNGLDRTIQKVEKISENVAAGISGEPGSSLSEGLSEIAQLPGLKSQAKANAKVFEASQDLLDDLAAKPRR